jgi:hypothetical protein
VSEVSELSANALKKAEEEAKAELDAIQAKQKENLEAMDGNAKMAMGFMFGAPPPVVEEKKELSY